MEVGPDRTGAGDAEKEADGIARWNIDCGTVERGLIEVGALLETVELV